MTEREEAPLARSGGPAGPGAPGAAEPRAPAGAAPPVPPAAGRTATGGPASLSGLRPPAAGPGAPGTARRRGRQGVVAALKALVSAALIWWLLRDTSLSEVARSLRSADLRLFAAALGLYTLRYAVGALRWRVLLRPLGVRASVPFLFRSNLIAVFFNNFLPSIIGGEAIRIYDSWRLGTGRTGAVTVVLLDRFLGMLALVLFALAAALASRPVVDSLGVPHLTLWVLLGGLAMGVASWLVFAAPPRLARLVDRLRIPAQGGRGAAVGSSLLAFRGEVGAFVKALGLSFLVQMAVILHYYAIAGAIGFSVPLGAFFLIVPIAVLVMMLPISINAIGIRENIFAFLLSLHGVAKADAVAFAWLAYLVVVLLGVSGGVIMAVRREGRVQESRGGRERSAPGGP